MMDNVENVDKNQLLFAIQAFIMFLNPASKTRVLPKEKIHSIREKGIELLERIQSGKMDPLQGKEAFNKLIGISNKLMHPKETTAPYPVFSTLSPKHQSKNEVVAFEYFLNQKFIAGEITLAQEAPLFKEALLLWRDVGLTLSPEQCHEKLSTLIEKMNQYFDTDHYPLPPKE